MERINIFLNYLATHPNAKLVFRESCMILKVDSDESYLSIPGGRSRAAGHFYFGNNIPLDQEDIIQGAVHAEYSIIKPVVSSASESSIAALCINTQKVIIIRRILKELGHPQPPTPIRWDNTTTESFINGTIIPKRSKAMDMIFWWLRNKNLTKKLKIYWKPVKVNRAYYYSKHHSGAYHLRRRKYYVANATTENKILQNNKITREYKSSTSHSDGKICYLRGCVNIVSRSTSKTQKYF